MSSSRLAVAASLVTLIVLAACSAGPVAPSASPSGPPVVVVPSVAPSVAPDPSVTPDPSVSPPPATPTPTKTPVAGTPRPTAIPFTADEQDLLDGVQRGAEDCQPARGDALPVGAIAGIECDSTEAAIARLGFYRFANDENMIDAYVARFEAEGVDIDSGSGCADGDAEHAYFPGEGFIAERAGCFVNDEGFANYRYTLPGEHVYVGMLGRSSDMAALESFAWVGNADTPGIPTLWFGGID